MGAVRKPWKLIVGGRIVESASHAERLQGRKARFWIRNRRGRGIEICNMRGGHTIRWTPRGWFTTQIEWPEGGKMHA